MLSISHISWSQGKVAHGGLSWMNRFPHQFIQPCSEDFLKISRREGKILPSLSAWEASGWAQPSRIGISKQVPPQLRGSTWSPKGCRDSAKGSYTAHLYPGAVPQQTLISHGLAACGWSSMAVEPGNSLSPCRNAVTDHNSNLPGKCNDKRQNFSVLWLIGY